MRCMRCRCRRRPDQGAALIEFALVLPIFALMLFAMIQFGLIFAGWAQLRNAVQTDARMASLGALGPEVTTLPIPADAQCLAAHPRGGLTTCTDYSWLDGYYIDGNSGWQQIVAGQPTGNQITDQQAFQDGADNGPWSCSETYAGDCTELSTNVSGAATDALGVVRPQCGNQPTLYCQVALELTQLMGSPVGLSTSPTALGQRVTTLPIPEDAQCLAAHPRGGLTTCTDYSWLDGYYIDGNGGWQQIVAGQPAGNQISDQQAFQDGTDNGPWSCSETYAGDCTELSTNVSGAATGALGSDVGLACNPGCAAGNTMLVCAQLAATSFTGLLPKMAVSTKSTFYIETGTGSTLNQGGIPCG